MGMLKRNGVQHGITGKNGSFSADARTAKLLVEKVYAAECPKGLEYIRKQYETAYGCMPAFSKLLCDGYLKILASRNLKPGRIWLYTVGGRIKKTPLSDISDIDMLITVQYPDQVPVVWRNTGLFGIPCLVDEKNRLPSMLSSSTVAKGIWGELNSLKDSLVEKFEIMLKGEPKYGAIDLIETPYPLLKIKPAVLLYRSEKAEGPQNPIQ